MSGGQRQILAMLMVLEKKPDILFLDETTSALDDENASQAFSFLQDITKEHGIAIVIVSHDIELVKRFASHIVRLS